jgi:hypothetical protein
LFNVVDGKLKGKNVNLAQRTWDALNISTICEDILRIKCVEAAMELDRKDFIELLWCWTLENWCVTDLMWHAMIGSTSIHNSRIKQVSSFLWYPYRSYSSWFRTSKRSS